MIFVNLLHLLKKMRSLAHQVCVFYTTNVNMWQVTEDLGYLKRAAKVHSLMIFKNGQNFM